MSVVVPATNEPGTLGRCVAAIRAAAEPPEEVIVIDRPQNTGPAQARNLGASKATQDVLVFVDADVEVAPDVFRKIRCAFDCFPELTALFGSYDDAPSEPSLVSSFRNLLHHYVHQSAAGPAGTFWAGLGAIRRADFLAFGGFDEERFPHASVEDIELGMRLTQDGKRILLDPAIQGKHLKHWTLTTMIRTDLQRRGVPWVRLVLDSGASSNALNLGWRHRASAVLSVALVAALVAQRPRVVGTSGLVLVALNRRFYALLIRRLGLLRGAAGIPLHILHHLTSVAAVPIALSQHLLARVARDRDFRT